MVKVFRFLTAQLLLVLSARLIACSLCFSPSIKPNMARDAGTIGSKRDSSNDSIQLSADPSISRSSFLLGVASFPLVAQASSVEGPSGSTESRPPNAFQESISGFAAGGAVSAVKTTVKYPLDTATVRLQMPNSAYSVRNLLSLFENAYSGIWVPLLANIPAGSVFFAVKDASKSILREMGGGRLESTALAVGIAQIPYWFLRNPSEVVKTRQQAQLEGYTNVSAIEAYNQVRRDSLKENNVTLGLDGFYVGYTENILYAFPADLIKFVAYDFLSGGRKNLAPVEGALAGAAATAIAQFATTPLDVVRNRIMTQKSQQRHEERENDGFASDYINTLFRLGREEGVRGLFAGVTPRVSKAIVSGAIQFATYEETKKQIIAILRGTKGTS